jgi:hypothetical protein
VRTGIQDLLAPLWTVCIDLGQKSITGRYTIRKAFRYSRPQPGYHLPNSPWAEIKFESEFPPRESLVSYPGWGWEYRKAFFTVYALARFILGIPADNYFYYFVLNIVLP